MGSILTIDVYHDIPRDVLKDGFVRPMRSICSTSKTHADINTISDE